MGARQKVIPLMQARTLRGSVVEFTVASKRNSLRISRLGAAAWVLAGCSSAVVVESEFPTPLVEPVPLTIGLHYDDELRDFIHAEALPRSATWTIDLGDANVAMLDPLFDTMFTVTREISELPPSPAELVSLDAVLSSTLAEYQFDVPQASRDEFVEVWLQYRLQLIEPDGDVVIEWEVPGYGKAEISSDREEAVHRASIVAMREAGALISTQFIQQPQVSDWLEDIEDARTQSQGG
jgi:hypothetical protein